MNILEKPNFPPYVCLTCGVGYGRRWFVQLDFPLDNYFNPVVEGQIFQCNECWEALATSVAKAAQTFLIGTEPWESTDYVEPTYDNVTELKKEISFGNTRESGREIGTGSHSTQHSRTTELSNPEPTVSDSKPDEPDTDDEGDDESLREFRVFFDDTGGTAS